MKIMEGWMTSPKLTGFFGGAQAWYNSILGVAGEEDVTSHATGEAAEETVKVVKAAADAVSSATGAGEGAAEGAGNVATHVGTVIFNFDFFGLFQAFLVSGKSLWESTLSDMAFKLDIPLMNWFVGTAILPHDGVQVAMQIFIVLAEILIGLALMGGLFTLPASGFSLILQFMFVATTGLYLNTFWMIFAAIAVLVGGGRTFGLDYYAMPALKKGWKKIPVVRKSYLYHD
jgi:NADH dehydrogenase